LKLHAYGTLNLTFLTNLTPSSELKVSRLFSAKCHFGGNELAYREEACRNWSAVTTSFFSVSQLISIEMTLRGEESTHFQF